MRALWRSLRRRHGQGLVELAFILVLVVIMCILGLTELGQKATDPIDNVSNALP